MPADESVRMLASIRLRYISTQWSTLNNPSQFVLRYGPAIHAYLRALIRDSHDAEEVEQQFLTQVLERGFTHVSPERGRFRHYLIKMVRNAALTHLRRPRREKPVADLTQVPTHLEADREWQSEWRKCVLNSAWRALRRHEHEFPDSLLYTVLRLSTARTNDSSTELAARVSRKSGREIRPDAFRKQLSRARRRFAELVVEEVARTIDDPTDEAVADELAALALMRHIQPLVKRSR
jgi:RNA polymerase sigma factor (sigma-70 family)